MNNRIVFDSKASVRHVDENGFMHVARTNITKETVNPYYGREIPGWVDLGLDPDHIYYGYRDGGELARGAHTFNGLPLLLGHHIESAEEPQTKHRVGSLGTDAQWIPPFLTNSLIVTDARAIAAIEDGSARELSCAYMYDPDFTPGTFDGHKYDFVMRNIRGNHIALVEEGRAGPDVVVADSSLAAGEADTTARRLMKHILNSAARKQAVASDEALEQEEKDLARVLVDLQKTDPATGKVGQDEDDAGTVARIKAVTDKITDALPPDEIRELVQALSDLGKAPGNGATDEEEIEMEEEKKPLPEEEKPIIDADESIEEEPAVDEEEVPAYDEEIKACGMDADDPVVQKAFAEGVKHGQSLGEKAEDEDPETPAEDECETPAEDEGFPAEENEGEEPAQDEEGEEDAKAAMDAAIKRSKAETLKHFRALSVAAEAVRPILGRIEPLAFDSAADIYGAALRKAGVDTRKHPKTAWRSMFAVMRTQAVGDRARIAQDGAIRSQYSGVFAGLHRIKH